MVASGSGQPDRGVHGEQVAGPLVVEHHHGPGDGDVRPVGRRQHRPGTRLVLPDADQTVSVSYLAPIDRRYASDANLRAIVGTPVNVEASSPGTRPPGR
jgi:hypothetical protein